MTDCRGSSSGGSCVRYTGSPRRGRLSSGTLHTGLRPPTVASATKKEGRAKERKKERVLSIFPLTLNDPQGETRQKVKNSAVFHYKMTENSRLTYFPLEQQQQRPPQLLHSWTATAVAARPGLRMV